MAAAGDEASPGGGLPASLPSWQRGEAGPRGAASGSQWGRPRHGGRRGWGAGALKPAAGAVVAAAAWCIPHGHGVLAGCRDRQVRPLLPLAALREPAGRGRSRRGAVGQRLSQPAGLSVPSPARCCGVWCGWEPAGGRGEV